MTDDRIDEEVVPDVVEKEVVHQADEGDIAIEEEAPEVPIVEIIAPTRDKGKQRAISPDVPVEPAQEDEGEQEEMDVEMRDVEEDEPLEEVLDPDESIRQAWVPQPPRQVRARHDTSSLESPARTSSFVLFRKG